MQQKKTAIALAAIVCLLLTACTKNSSANSKDGDFGTGPRSQVPDALVGYWINGTTSISNFWNYNGTYAGAANELALGYLFFKDGRAKEYFYYTSTSTYCRTQVLGCKLGTVKFDETAKTFTFYPAGGSYRGFNSCGNAQSPGFGETKPYTTAELYPTKSSTYTNYSLINVNGKEVIRVPYSDGSSANFEKSAEPR